MSPQRSRLGLALQLTDVVRHRTVGGRDYPASIADAAGVVELARRLEPYISTFWLTDNLGYRHTTTLLGAIAATTFDLHLGTFTAFPYGRSPVDTAAALATLRELMPGREVSFGISRGGGPVSALHRAERPLRLLREYVTTLRALMAGEEVDTDSTPELVRTHAVQPGRRMRSFLDPVRVPLMVTATGRRGLRLSGSVGDGVQFVTQQPTQSAALLAEPDFDGRSGLRDLERARALAAPDRTFHRIYGISVSVATDPRDAVNFARRQIAGVLATKNATQMDIAGMDPGLPDRIRSAMRTGGLAEASRWVPTEVVTALVATGSADDVANRVIDVVARSQKWGFTEHFICFPLGPNIMDAINMITNRILPAVH